MQHHPLSASAGIGDTGSKISIGGGTVRDGGCRSALFQPTEEGVVI